MIADQSTPVITTAANGLRFNFRRGTPQTSECATINAFTKPTLAKIQRRQPDDQRPEARPLGVRGRVRDRLGGEPEKARLLGQILRCLLVADRQEADPADEHQHERQDPEEESVRQRARDQTAARSASRSMVLNATSTLGWSGRDASTRLPGVLRLVLGDRNGCLDPLRSPGGARARRDLFGFRRHCFDRMAGRRASSPDRDDNGGHAGTRPLTGRGSSAASPPATSPMIPSPAKRSMANP